MPAGLDFCRVCEESHTRPVGRNCRRKKQVGEVAATIGSVSGPAQTNDTVTAAITPDVGSMILSKLSNISEQIDSLDGRVWITEAALADRTTDLASGKKSNT